jgi:hypothetical protein
MSPIVTCPVTGIYLDEDGRICDRNGEVLGYNTECGFTPRERVRELTKTELRKIADLIRTRRRKYGPRSRVALRILELAPLMAQSDIAEKVGCSRQYVHQVIHRYANA